MLNDIEKPGSQRMWMCSQRTHDNLVAVVAPLLRLVPDSPLDACVDKLCSCCDNKHPKARRAFKRVKTPHTFHACLRHGEGGFQARGLGALHVGRLRAPLQMEVPAAVGRTGRSRILPSFLNMTLG